MLKQVFQQVTPQQAVWKLPGSHANTIGATFTHAYKSEDDAVHSIQGKPSVWESGGWASRLGYDDEAWSFSKTPDPAQLTAYAEAVTKDTEAYLDRLAPEALDSLIETRRRPRPLAIP